MNAILENYSEQDLSEAIEANLVELFRSGFRTWDRLEFHDEPDMLWGITDIPFPLFNPVLRARLAANTVDAKIEAAIERCKARNVGMLWWIGPGTDPPDLGDRLEAHGFLHSGTAPGMAVDLAVLNEPATVPPNVSVQQVTDEETLRIWVKTLIDGFGMPDFSEEFADGFLAAGFGPTSPSRLFLAWQEDEPVATSSLYLGAGVAGIYNVATLPSARGRGVGTALTLRPLMLARAEGYRVGILQSSDMGFSVYRRLGFKEYCRLEQYVWPAGD